MSLQYKFFLINAKSPEENEGELNRFLKSVKVVDVQREFFSHGDNIFWALSIEYMDVAVGGQKPPYGRKQKIDYRDVLSDADFTMFSKLRELRKTIAESEGVPVYTVFTNEQLAEMVTKKITTKSDMGGIVGIGEAKLEKYADKFLKFLNSEKK
ncbi:MAG: hypothetical protein GY777_19560 [Candidatus Brocadiaceae bacterium]|nr:hypothetical protein [Candidatus Brocadiaceae bacterium]